MVKPTIVSGQIGWYVCPKCNTRFFPLVRNPIPIYDERPNKCTNCGEQFDWSEFDKIISVFRREA